MPHVLIVDSQSADPFPDDDRLLLMRSSTVKKAREAIRNRPPDLVLTEVVLPDGDARDVIRLGSAHIPSIPVAVFSAAYTSDTVFEAIGTGAFDCLSKPLSLTALKMTLSRLPCVNRRRVRMDGVETAFPRADVVVGGNPDMIRAYRTAAATAPTGANIFIRGQSGTGKELLARSIHAASGRPGPFVAVN